MNLEFSGQEVIAAPKDRVWSYINDPSSIASCLPDVQDVQVHDAHTFDASVRVAVGPVRGKLKFKILLDPQPDGEHMNMKISGGGFGSVVDLLAGADVKGDGASTTLDWHGTATMRGPVATVGGRVLDAQAKSVISTVFSNVKARLSGATA
ncbi:MAG: SRPBCC family protein [Vulcanimicrobiaceae bacterium]